MLSEVFGLLSAVFVLGIGRAEAAARAAATLLAAPTGAAAQDGFFAVTLADARTGATLVVVVAEDDVVEVLAAAVLGAVALFLASADGGFAGSTDLLGTAARGAEGRTAVVFAEFDAFAVTLLGGAFTVVGGLAADTLGDAAETDAAGFVVVGLRTGLVVDKAALTVVVFVAFVDVFAATVVDGFVVVEEAGREVGALVAVVAGFAAGVVLVTAEDAFVAAALDTTGAALEVAWTFGEEAALLVALGLTEALPPTVFAAVDLRSVAVAETTAAETAAAAVTAALDSSPVATCSSSVFDVAVLTYFHSWTSLSDSESASCTPSASGSESGMSGAAP